MQGLAGPAPRVSERGSRGPVAQVTRVKTEACVDKAPTPPHDDPTPSLRTKGELEHGGLAGGLAPPSCGEPLSSKCIFAMVSAHRASRGRGIRRGTRRGRPGDSRGTRWGFPGDSLPFWGTRSEKAIIFFGFQGDSPETTFGFYNIKRGLVVAGGGMRGRSRRHASKILWAHGIGLLGCA